MPTDTAPSQAGEDQLFKTSDMRLIVALMTQNVLWNSLERTGRQVIFCYSESDQKFTEMRARIQRGESMMVEVDRVFECINRFQGIVHSFR